MKVLILDDHQPNVMLLSLLINKMKDITSIEFNSSFDALEWCKTEEPDLILVDYMMPEMDGIEFIKQFRALKGRAMVPVVMITAHTESAIRYQALEATANDFLNKPIDSAELSARVKNMLALRKAQIQLSNRAAWLAEEVKKATAQILKGEREVVYRLSRAAEYRDPETGAHILRMSHYAGLIAKNLGLSEDEQALIIDAAPMHDIGKIGIPDNVLLKPGRLDPDEFNIIKQHPEFGRQMLTGSSSRLLQTAEIIAYCHHEKFDGSGYPRGLTGEEIPLYGRIVSLADVFDALTSARPYKPAWPLEKAVDFIHAGTGSHFDPKCVEAFFKDWDQVLEIHHNYKDEEEF